MVGRRESWEKRTIERMSETIARLERERLTFLDTIATLNNECNAWEAALTESRADAARMRLALEFLPDWDGDIDFRAFDAKYPECKPLINDGDIARAGAARARAARASHRRG